MAASPLRTLKTVEVVRNGRALLGFMDETTALGFLQGMCVWDSESAHKDFKRMWQTARDAAKKLPAGYSAPEAQDLPPSSRNHIERVKQMPLFKNAFANTEFEFKAVEIDRILAFQQFVDTDYSALSGFKHTPLGDPDLLERCLPTQFPLEVTVHANKEERSVTIISRQMNPTIDGFGFGQGPDGRPAVQFFLGTNANFIQTVEYRGRVLLKNGYHRVYAAKQAGLTHIPCIYIHAHELLETGAVREGFFGEKLLYSDRPPLLKHFNDDTIAPPIKLGGVKKLIRIRVDETVLPA